MQCVVDTENTLRHDTDVRCPVLSGEMECGMMTSLDKLAQKIDSLISLQGDVFAFQKWIIKGLLIVVCALALGKELLMGVGSLYYKVLPSATAQTK